MLCGGALNTYGGEIETVNGWDLGFELGGDKALRDHSHDLIM